MTSPLKNIVIGSRGSDLALWQAHHVKAQLEALNVTVEIKIITTRGDKIQNIGFDKMEGKGFFTKEIEDALLKKEIDVAVHSHKDLETNPPEGLTIAAVSDREDPSELLLMLPEAYDATQAFSLKQGALVGTSSARRKSQMLLYRPDVELKDLRGNVPTRIQKLRDGNYDAILLAKAGVSRLELDLSDFHVETLDPRVFVPAPAQGVLGLQTRSDDAETIQLLQNLNNPETQERIAIERKVLNLFQGGCQLPLGVYANGTGDQMQIWSAMATGWDTPVKRHYFASKQKPAAIVETLQKQTSGTVFISRKLSENSPFRQVLQAAGLVVEAWPLISTEPVEVVETPKSDWIFFSSPKAVRYFAKSQNVTPTAKLAAVGEGTAKAITRQGWLTSFVGQLADTEEVGKEFAAIAANETVLFPISAQSLKTVQQQLPQENVIDLVIYNTMIDDQAKLPEADIVVYTSPSNIQSWLTKGSKPAGKVVAMGKATGEQLAKNGITEYQLPWGPSELALADAVLDVLS